MALHKLDDLPVHLYNRLDDPLRQRLVSMPADAKAEQYNWDWIPAQLARASAEVVGPAWIGGCDVILQSEGTANAAPSVRVFPGIARPLEVYSGKHYAKRVLVPEDILDIGSEFAIIAVQPDPTTPGGGRAIVQSLSEERIRATQFETFYYVPPEAALDLMVPLAFVQCSLPTPEFPYGKMIALIDLRLPQRGYVVAEKMSPWKIPFAGWEPDSGAIDNRPWLAPQEAYVQWIELNGLPRPLFLPEGKRFQKTVGQVLGEDDPVGVWMMVPRGFEIELGLSCMIRGRNTLRATPTIDGADLSSEGDDGLVFEFAEQKKAPQGEDRPRTACITAIVPNPVPGVHFLSWGVRGFGQYDQSGEFDNSGQPTAYLELSKMQVRARLVRALEKQEFIRERETA